MREHFPYFANHPEEIFLDSAATTHKPKVVIDTIANFYQTSYGTVHRGGYPSCQKASALYESVRHKLARFVNVPAEEILFTKGTTESINLLAGSFPPGFLMPGDKILVCKTAHHANLLPWQRLAEKTGATLEILPDNLEIDPKAKIVALCHVSNVLGTHYPLHAIDKKNALLFVDGAQAIGQMPIDLQNLPIDAYAGSSHKMFGPSGVGFLWAKKSLLEKLLPYNLGGAMVEEVSYTNYRPASIPQKFEPGTPAIESVIGWGAALDFIQELGIEKIHTYKKELGDFLESKLTEIEELTLFHSPQGAPIYSFIIKEVHSLDIATLLGAKNISVRSGMLCAEPLVKSLQKGPLIRVSPSIYNTQEEIFSFIFSLKKIIRSLS